MKKWFALVLVLGACGDVAPCEFDGVSYAHGDTFLADDGCNTCTCENAEVFCTEMACIDDTGS